MLIVLALIVQAAPNPGPSPPPASGTETIVATDPLVRRNSDGSMTLSAIMSETAGTDADRAKLLGIIAGTEAVCKDLGGIRQSGSLTIAPQPDGTMLVSQQVMCRRRAR